MERNLLLSHSNLGQCAKISEKNDGFLFKMDRKTWWKFNFHMEMRTNRKRKKNVNCKEGKSFFLSTYNMNAVKMAPSHGSTNLFSL